MNCCLKFRSPQHENAHEQSVNLYLERTLMFVIALLIVYITGQLYLMVENYGVQRGLLTSLGFNAALVITAALLKIAQRHSQKLAKYGGWLRNIVDFIVLGVVSIA